MMYVHEKIHVYKYMKDICINSIVESILKWEANLIEVCNILVDEVFLERKINDWHREYHFTIKQFLCVCLDDNCYLGFWQGFL